MSEIPGPSPDQMNLEASMRQKSEVSGLDAPAQALGLQNMDFTVRRNIYDQDGKKQDGFTEEAGWFVQSTHEIQDEKGNQVTVARIRRNAPDVGQTEPGTPYKDVLASELQSWQHNEDEADIETIPREELNRLKSTMGAGRQDVEGSSAAEEAKKYWYSPEEASAIDKSKYPQHEESQDSADQWWNQEQAQESKELAAHPEISAEVAEEVGEVAIESSQIIEAPDSVHDDQSNENMTESQIDDADVSVPEQLSEDTVSNTHELQTESDDELADESIVENSEVESQEVESQPEQPDLSKIFESVESFEQAMANPDVDESTKRDMFEINQSWQMIKLSSVGSQVWDELVAPHLREVVDSTPQLQMRTEQTSELMNNMLLGLRRLGDAIGSRDMQNIADVTRRYHFGDMTEDLRTNIAKLSNDPTLSDATKKLAVGSWQGEERVALVRGGMQKGASEEMVSDISKYLEQGMDVEQIKEELANISKREIGGRNPLAYRDMIDGVVRFSREVDQNDIGRRSSGVISRLEMMMDDARRGRFDEAEVFQISAMINQLNQEVERLRDSTRMIRLYSEQIQR